MSALYNPPERPYVPRENGLKRGSRYKSFRDNAGRAQTPCASAPVRASDKIVVHRAYAFLRLTQRVIQLFFFFVFCCCCFFLLIHYSTLNREVCASPLAEDKTAPNMKAFIVSDNIFRYRFIYLSLIVFSIYIFIEFFKYWQIRESCDLGVSEHF